MTRTVSARTVTARGPLKMAIIAAGCVVISGGILEGVAQVEPRLVTFPSDGDSSSDPASPAPVLKPVKAKCYFSPLRVMSLLLSNEITKDAQAKGYTKVKASVSFKLPRVPVVELKPENVEGISSIAASTTLNYTLKMNANIPADIGCAMETTVFIKVSGVSKSGEVVTGKTSQKMVVRGSFK